MLIKRLTGFMAGLSITGLLMLGCEKMNGPQPYLSSPLSEEKVSILMDMVQPWKQEPPPPQMLVYVKDSPVDTIKCSRLDPSDGITFLDNGQKMRVIFTDYTPDYETKNWEVNLPIIKTTRYYSTSIIDSITFTASPPPVEETPPPAE